MFKKGALVDASVIDSTYKPKGKASFEIETDRIETSRPEEELEKEHQEKKLQKIVAPGVDTDAA